MKTFLKILAIVVITVIILIVALFGYLIIKNPFGTGDIIKSLIFKQEMSEEVKQENIEKNVNYDHPYLNEEQEQKIIDAGIDIEKIPTEISQEQIDCAVEKLGEARAKEIEGGAEPTSLEILKVLPCAGK